MGIIGNSVCDLAKQAWSHPENVGDINATDICLIPKVPKPEYVNQFRPISLCNVNYKILSKIVVNRLKPIMTDIISPFQIGFISQRSIHENIIVAQEMLHSMHKMRGKNSIFTIKVDLAKAYDMLKWSFIKEVLIEVGLPVPLISFVMQCLTSVKTNVLWNGSRSEFFMSERGIRQGDPMSPYIFVLCMDKLSHLISHAVDNGRWKPMRAGRNGPMVSHLMFAADLLLFGKASVEHLANIKKS